jgi:hypothetical protein
LEVEVGVIARRRHRRKDVLGRKRRSRLVSSRGVAIGEKTSSAAKGGASLSPIFGEIHDV